MFKFSRVGIDPILTINNKNNFQIKSNFWIIFGVVTIVVATIIWWLYFCLLASVNNIYETKHFTVQSGQSITSIAEDLEQEGFIKSVWGFKAWLKITGKVIVQPGSYELSSSYNTPTVANIIASGDTANATVTIPEGYTLKQIAKLLENKDISTEEEFMEIVNNFPPDYEFSKYWKPDQTLEGFLFPDTYKLIKGDTLTAVRVMLDNFGVKYKNDIKSDLGDRDLYKIITIASMVEREAKTQEDREQITAVIYNRLDIGMKLDIDATVRYITNNWTDPISRSDLTIDSPYNTRKYAGLPPGPICNPGLASIKAALNPPSSDYYYYLTDLEGITHYSKTLQEHNKNKVEYLL